MIFTAVPEPYSSVNSDLVWVAYDANSQDNTKLNYKYVGELWIDGVKIYTSKVFPRPDTFFGVFNFATIIREYITAKLSPTTDGIFAQEMGETDFCITVQIKIREEYNGSVGSVVLTDDFRTFYNHYQTRFTDFTTQGSFTYTFDFILGFINYPNSTRNRTDIKLFFETGRYYIPYFSNTTDPFNVVIGSNTKVITPTEGKSLTILNISPGAINEDYPGTITSSTTSYAVVIDGVSYTVKLICEPIYKKYMIHFLNKFGGFESMSFHKVSRESVDIERKEWQQLPYRITDLGAVTLSENQVMHEQRSVFASRFKEKLKISTDLLNDEDYEWLVQLVVSPLVYLEDQNTLYPVVITNTDYEYKKYINDRLTSLAIDIEFGNMLKTQFR
jgi:hypothetical protein